MSTCKICSQELIIELDPEDFNEATSSAAGGSSTSVPDDLLLTCGCHFHWQCFLDESPQIVTSLACPSCNRFVGSTSTTLEGAQQLQVLTKYHNEGGIQVDLDVLPLIKEEAYLVANPAARPARAFMTMCSEGDVGGIIELLKAIEEDEDDDEGSMSSAELLRYQDPLDGMKTGLHIAIEKSREEAVWLLLWLASSVPTAAFPAEVSQASQAMGQGRDTARGPDIRGLRDEQERTARDIAATMGNTWAGFLATGLLEV
ncbi:hypothetical protein M430DRAFT_32152 [Amorphotheca resinae ATCC 22711]|uniref:Uncharacterized protein n=1 Tax=Amorphotheca resinae ATCC 22711 TaxID=857342 RepID=A0A2T3BDD9_AMORE|nr:hypothetical protein M430DRAFT_32152 [Amorphotheca resinae ATCC 22711]PSS27406.1 hypothetical protein M430DRAFT_32152 [Amorphotheca resinae ATCC 22711]